MLGHLEKNKEGTSALKRKWSHLQQEIIFLATFFISYWASLQKGDGWEELEAGAGVLKTAAIHLHPRNPEDAGMVLLVWKMAPKPLFVILVME